ncbi:hypothetical protein CANARDRAFT_186366, partial [[Candida] arabinofermentans NRRL YB-2248]
MNHFDEHEDNIWDDVPPANPSASVLFNPSDNPYSSGFNSTFDRASNDEQHVAEDLLEEVDFNSDPTPPPTQHHHIFDELSNTMNSITLAPPKEEEGEEDKDAEYEGDTNNRPEDKISPEELDEMKQKKKELLSSLVQNDDDSNILGKSILSDTPRTGEDLFTTIADKKADNGPLGNILSLAANDSTPETVLEHPTSASNVTSPNKKTRILRPRRVVKKASVALRGIESPQSPLDPLSLQPQDNESDSSSLKGDSTSKQTLLSSMNKPLFDIKQPKTASPVKKQPHIETSQPASKKSNEGSTKPIDTFDITVGDPVKVSELASSHIVYSITTKTKSKLLRNEESTVTRRYSDFLWLYNQLLNNHPGHIIPPPPEKQVYGRFDEKFIENRRLALEKMLIKISKSPILQNDYDFIIFLQSENFSIESKEREFIHYHGEGAENQSITDGEGSANDFSTASIINQTNAAASTSGSFFGSLISLNVPKYVENDQFVLDKQVYIENLDQQLRSLSKTLDFILEKRDEVILSMNELIVIIQQLTDLEINNELSELFANFEELQTKVKELLERTNLQQILTLGSTIDEYTRTIGSIRNCFETRFKLCNNIVTLQSQHSKKQKNLIKFKSKNHNQLDKIKRYEDELSSMESMINKQEEFKIEFNNNLKTDLMKFESDKINDFKSMIEIYWEGLVESQKELIELWESFYEKCKFE